MNNKIFMKVSGFLILSVFLQASYCNPVNDLPFEGGSALVNFFVEIPAGTKEKWEVNKETGLLEIEKKQGKKRVVNFLSYPGNYGFIPQTLSGDGDPIDLIDLDDSTAQGEVKQVRIIGAIYFEDKKEPDYKFVGVSPEGTFKKIKTIEELLLLRPSVVEIIKLWFLSYKKPGKMTFIKYIDSEDSLKILEESHQKWLETHTG